MAEMTGSMQGQESRPRVNGAEEGGGIVTKVKDTATAQLTNQKNRATDGFGAVAQAVRQSTQQLRDQHHETVAGYVEQAADQMDRLSQRLRNKDVAELVGDLQRLAKSQPALFIGGAFALGLIAARFFKSSSEGDSQWTARSSGNPYSGGFDQSRTYGQPSGMGTTGSGSRYQSQPQPVGSPQMPSTEGGRGLTDTPGDSPAKGTGPTSRTRRGAQTERS